MKEQYVLDHKGGIGKITKNRSSESGNDDQQEEFLMKKSTVLPGQSTKNSHVFSDMYLQRVDKIKPKPEKKKKEPQQITKYSFDQ